MADNEPDRQFDSKNPRRLVSTFFFFFLLTYLLVVINEDRNTVSSPQLQIVFIEEVAYVKKIIVTGGIK